MDAHLLSLDRQQLLEWLLPYCEINTVCVMYPKGKSDGPGWVNGQEDSQRAINAYRAGFLASESFDSFTQDGKPYRITNGSRLAVVPHRDGGVLRLSSLTIWLNRSKPSGPESPTAWGILSTITDRAQYRTQSYLPRTITFCSSVFAPGRLKLILNIA